jgi:hypothetical protein
VRVVVLREKNYLLIAVMAWIIDKKSERATVCARLEVPREPPKVGSNGLLSVGKFEFPST